MIIKPSKIASHLSDGGGCSSNRRAILYEVQDGICYWHFFGKCVYKGERMLRGKNANPHSSRYATFEHLKELRKGGDNGPLNVVLAHAKCNTTRNRNDYRVETLRSRLKSYFGISMEATKWMER